MWESQISGWQADWSSVKRHMQRHHGALTALQGAALTGGWTVRVEADGSWFSDAPVVLEFDHGQRLEICWMKNLYLSLSWNTIDLDKEPESWLPGLTWNNWAEPALKANHGSRLTSLATTEFRTRRAAWQIWGLWLGTSGPGIHVFNNDDENGLEASFTEDDCQRMLPLTNSPVGQG